MNNDDDDNIPNKITYEANLANIGSAAIAFRLCEVAIAEHHPIDDQRLANKAEAAKLWARLNFEHAVEYRKALDPEFCDHFAREAQKTLVEIERILNEDDDEDDD